jgi:hypothetical protein
MEKHVLRKEKNNISNIAKHQFTQGETKMQAATKAIETIGTIDAQHHLVLDETLPITGPTRVRVIILLPEDSDISETEWLQAAAANPAFDFLKDPEEDIYTLSDGRPFYDEG